jgi:hypothetical protein
MLLGDFSAKLCREVIFKPMIKNEILNKIIIDGRLRVVHLATSKNLTVKSTMFSHRKINKYNLVSPDGKDHNRIDYILIDEAIRMH